MHSTKENDMVPIEGKWYRVRIASPVRKSYDDEVVYQCLGPAGYPSGVYIFDVPLPHPDDEGRGTTIRVAESDVLAEVEAP
jgi:hypothetical protein